MSKKFKGVLYYLGMDLKERLLSLILQHYFILLSFDFTTLFYPLKFDLEYLLGNMFTFRGCERAMIICVNLKVCNNKLMST